MKKLIIGLMLFLSLPVIAESPEQYSIQFVEYTEMKNYCVKDRLVFGCFWKSDNKIYIAKNLGVEFTNEVFLHEVGHFDK